MMQEIVRRFPFLHLSSVALLIFFGFFVALLFIVNTKSQKKIHERASVLPLEDGVQLKGTHRG